MGQWRVKEVSTNDACKNCDKHGAHTQGRKDIWQWSNLQTLNVFPTYTDSE